MEFNIFVEQYYSFNLKYREAAAIGWSREMGTVWAGEGGGCICICCPAFVTRHLSWQFLSLCNSNTSEWTQSAA